MKQRARKLHEQYVLMVGSQQGVKIYQVYVNIYSPMCIPHLILVQKSTRKLMLSAETSASSCSRIFSQNREHKAASSEQEKEMEKKLEDLKELFNSTYPALLR